MNKGVPDLSVLNDKHAGHLKTVTNGAGQTMSCNDTRLKPPYPGVKPKKLRDSSLCQPKSSVVGTARITDVNGVGQIVFCEGSLRCLIVIQVYKNNLRTQSFDFRLSAGYVRKRFPAKNTAKVAEEDQHNR